MEIPNCGQVGVGPGSRRNLQVNVDAKGIQRVWGREHVADARTGQGGYWPQEPRAEHRSPGSSRNKSPPGNPRMPGLMTRDQRPVRLSAILRELIEFHMASVKLG